MSAPIIIPNANPNLRAVFLNPGDYELGLIVAWEVGDKGAVPVCAGTVFGDEADAILDESTDEVWGLHGEGFFLDLEAFTDFLSYCAEEWEKEEKALRVVPTPPTGDEVTP